ncbi:MAG: TonB-dependent receptor plug domain-containing protein, partial [Asticcacaulis sp.]
MKPGAFAKYCLLPFGMGLVELSGLARPAAAQTAARPAAQDGGKTSDHPATEVTVVGKKSDGADRIDRHVYDIKSDPDAQAGVAADVLAKLPSVQVSVSGKVSLRGNANVTVLVDGKYPANGNAAIQTLSAADIDRIEVMTNPSAQYAPDGTGGIINIVTRKSHPLGVSGSLSGRADTLGGGNLAGSAVFTSGPWSIDSRLSLVHSLYSGRMRMAQDLPVAAARDSDWTGASDSGIANLNIGYKLDDVSTLTFEGQAYRQDALTLSRGAYGSPGLSYADAERLSYGFVQTDIEGVYDYDNDKTGTHFTLDADHTDFDSPLRQSETDTYAAGDAVYGNSARTWGPEDNIKADFEHGFVSGNQLTAGIEWDQRLTHVERTYSDSGSVPGPVPDGSHHSYMADQALASAYVTYQMALGKWTLLPGLRGEWQRLSVSASGIDARTRALRLYPSLHL